MGGMAIIVSGVPIPSELAPKFLLAVVAAAIALYVFAAMGEKK
jgi:hypothetical protein